jgi:hypothetical protein
MDVDNLDSEKKAILNALEESCGVVSTACKSIGMPRSTFYNWLNTDSDFKAAVEELQEYALDVAESELHKLIKKGDTTAIIFYLKTKGKRRGYVEKVETGFTDKEGNDVPVTIFQLPDNGRSQTKDSAAATGISDENAGQSG